MRVIITGGTGLIGRKLTASLVSDNHEVIVLSRHPDQAHGLPDRARKLSAGMRARRRVGDSSPTARTLSSISPVKASAARD